ncbi:hypothetical protein ACFL2V_05660 [Pseudomonadota bacterium]
MPKTKQDFFAMSKWAFVGGVVGIFLGWGADTLGLYKNPIAEGVVRLTSGTMDSIAEIIFLWHLYFVVKKKTSVNPYVFGTFLGTIAAPITHYLVRSSGYDPYGPIGSIYAFAYSNSDNLFGSLVFLGWTIKRKRSFQKGWRSFIMEPFQQGNVISLISILILDVTARLIGFYPVKNILSGIEAAIMDADTVIASLFSMASMKKSRSRK